MLPKIGLASANYYSRTHPLTQAPRLAATALAPTCGAGRMTVSRPAATAAYAQRSEAVRRARFARNRPPRAEFRGPPRLVLARIGAHVPAAVRQGCALHGVYSGDVLLRPGPGRRQGRLCFLESG